MKKYLFLPVIFSAVLSCNSSRKNSSAAVSIDPYQYSTQKTITCTHGAVVSAHPLASKIGGEILKMGGNAIDAAIATQLALAVVYLILVRHFGRPFNDMLI